MFVRVFPTFGLGGLGSENRDVGLVIRNVPINRNCHRIPAFPLLLFFLLVLLNLSIDKVTTILLEVFEQVRYGTKALLSEKLVWF